MDPEDCFVIVAWREGEAEIFRVDAERFEFMRKAWIGQGYTNLQSEWFATERTGHSKALHLRVFVYWEQPDEVPRFEDVRLWGVAGGRLPIAR